MFWFEVKISWLQVLIDFTSQLLKGKKKEAAYYHGSNSFGLCCISFLSQLICLNDLTPYCLDSFKTRLFCCRALLKLYKPQVSSSKERKKKLLTTLAQTLFGLCCISFLSQLICLNDLTPYCLDSFKTRLFCCRALLKLYKPQVSSSKERKKKLLITMAQTPLVCVASPFSHNWSV